MRTIYLDGADELAPRVSAEKSNENRVPALRTEVKAFLYMLRANCTSSSETVDAENGAQRMPQLTDSWLV